MTQQQIRAETGPLGADGNLNVYKVPGSVLATPVSAAVIFDGTGAAGNFIPCLTFKTQTGAVIARCPAPEVAAGATAEVSWFPSVGSRMSSGASTFSGARIWSSTNQTVASGSGGGFGSPLNFDSLIFDTDGYSNLGVHPTRLTIPTTGYYEVGGCLAVALPGGAGFELQILIGLNGVASQIVSDAYAVPALGGPGSSASASVSTLYHFTAGDYIQLVLAQFSGGNIDSASQSFLCPIFWIARV